MYEDFSPFVKDLCPTSNYIDRIDLEENALLLCGVSLDSAGVSPDQERPGEKGDGYFLFCCEDQVAMG